MTLTWNSSWTVMSAQLHRSRNKQDQKVSTVVIRLNKANAGAHWWNRGSSSFASAVPSVDPTFHVYDWASVTLSPEMTFSHVQDDLRSGRASSYRRCRTQTCVFWRWKNWNDLHSGQDKCWTSGRSSIFAALTTSTSNSWPVTQYFFRHYTRKKLLPKCCWEAAAPTPKAGLRTQNDVMLERLEMCVFLWRWQQGVLGCPSVWSRHSLSLPPHWISPK